MFNHLYLETTFLADACFPLFLLKRALFGLKDHLSLEPDLTLRSQLCFEIQSRADCCAVEISVWFVSCHLLCPTFLCAKEKSVSTHLFDIGQLQYVREDVETRGLQQGADRLGQC